MPFEPKTPNPPSNETPLDETTAPVDYEGRDNGSSDS
jgi:hypothetical protein